MKKKLFFWFFLLTLFTTFNFKNSNNFITNFFSIKEINIFGVSNLNEKELEKKLQKIIGKNIFFLNQKNLESLYINMDFINSLKVKKIYPNKVNIYVKEDMPIGIYINNNGEKYLLLENKKIVKKEKLINEKLPEVIGQKAPENFSDFYKNIKKTKFDFNTVKNFSYFEVGRWDILLKNDKLIRLPPDNYVKSIIKFLEIHEKNAFQEFKLFDFRIKNELIVK